MVLSLVMMKVNRICDAWRERGEPDYIDEILTPFDESLHHVALKRVRVVLTEMHSMINVCHSY